MRKDLENNPRVIREDYPVLEPYVPKDAFDLLADGPVRPDQIDTVVLSHTHFDHSGDVGRFPSSQVIVGPGTRDCIHPGYPRSDDSPFDGSILAHGKLNELKRLDYKKFKAGDVPIGFSFDEGVDVFADGSFFVLDAPGHMPGHQMALARTGEDEWVAMGGDCCHHRNLLEDPSREISMDVGPNGQPGFHKDPADARATIGKTQALHANESVFVALAHDAQIDGIVPFYPQVLNGWRANGLKSNVRSQVLTLDEVKGRYR
ncbi:hypothetical protein H2200_001710 [Cladophialophora chaetospira]|uniref:Metallo-beta-lactamase domain-containing protein n=1 Tax=Cladophialophora chaetospira TaxID=386627 RepID=A0AA38XM82_9EURO|nr:hypothetical protein H2200_001710 [Cladophialophora chaetospira]